MRVYVGNILIKIKIKGGKNKMKMELNRFKNTKKEKKRN